MNHTLLLTHVANPATLTQGAADPALDGSGLATCLYSDSRYLYHHLYDDAGNVLSYERLPILHGQAIRVRGDWANTPAPAIGAPHQLALLGGLDDDDMCIGPWQAVASALLELHDAGRLYNWAMSSGVVGYYLANFLGARVPSYARAGAKGFDLVRNQHVCGNLELIAGAMARKHPEWGVSPQPARRGITFGRS